MSTSHARQVIESVTQDLKLAPRLLLRSPVLAATILLTLALGIGVNSGVYTLIDGILYRPRVANEPETFVRVNTLRTDTLGRANNSGLATAEEFKAYQQQSMLQAVTAWSPAHMTLGRTDAAETLGMLVSCDFFRVYGLVRPLLGRVFAGEECEGQNAAPVVVVGEALWRNKYRADSALIGRPITINAVAFVVIGILPDDFAGRTRGPGLWVPLTVQRTFFDGVDLLRADAPAWLNVEGRVARDVSRARVQSALQLAITRLASARPWNVGKGARTRQPRVQVTAGSMIDEPTVRAAAFWITPLIIGALCLILLLVCANVTMLLLARAVRRRPEMAIRLALGASRMRLFRMMLTESVFLSLVAGAAGVWLSYVVAASVAHTLFTADTPVYQVSPQTSTLMYLAGISLLTGIVAGWAPAVESLRQNIAESIRAAGIIGFRGRKHWNLRDSLVLVQVGVSTILIIGAGLFVRTQQTLAAVNPGFDADHTLLTTLDPPADGNIVVRDALLRAKLSALPQIKSIAFATSLPVADEGGAIARVRLSHAAGSTVHEFPFTAVSPEFFSTLGMRMNYGSQFSESQAGSEIIVSTALARLLWPDENVIGKQLILENGASSQVVGVVNDASGAGTREHVAQFYMRRNETERAGSLLTRFDGDAAAASARVRAVIREIDATATPITRTVRSILEERAERFWRLVRLVLLLAALAIVLSAVGMYGVVSFAVNQQAKALSIRLALGASRSAIIRQVVRTSGKPALIGSLVGLAIAVVGAWALERVFASTPVPVQAADPTVYALAFVFVVAIVLSAIAVPVRRAISLNVNEVLRD